MLLSLLLLVENTQEPYVLLGQRVGKFWFLNMQQKK